MFYGKESEPKDKKLFLKRTSHLSALRIFLASLTLGAPATAYLVDKWSGGMPLALADSCTRKVEVINTVDRTLLISLHQGSSKERLDEESIPAGASGLLSGVAASNETINGRASFRDVLRVAESPGKEFLVTAPCGATAVFRFRLSGTATPFPSDRVVTRRDGVESGSGSGAGASVNIGSINISGGRLEEALTATPQPTYTPVPTVTPLPTRAPEGTVTPVVVTSGRVAVEGVRDGEPLILSHDLWDRLTWLGAALVVGLGLGALGAGLSTRGGERVIERHVREVPPTSPPPGEPSVEKKGFRERMADRLRSLGRRAQAEDEAKEIEEQMRKAEEEKSDAVNRAQQAEIALQNLRNEKENVTKVLEEFKARMEEEKAKLEADKARLEEEKKATEARALSRKRKGTESRVKTEEKPKSGGGKRS